MSHTETSLRIAVLGAGGGGAAAAVELSAAGHRVALWNRSPRTLAPFLARGGIGHTGLLGQGTTPIDLITADLPAAISAADVALVTLPVFSHGSVARALAAAGWRSDRPVVLNPGHTGGALEFERAFRSVRSDVPPVAEFSTLTYIARKYAPDVVTVSGRTKRLRTAALPGGEAALAAACKLYPAAYAVRDVLAADLANVNMVLHPPAAILGAAWIEAKGAAFTFYVEGMTPGVTRTMRRLDDERRAVARAFGHDLPSLVREMQEIGTVEAEVVDLEDFRSAIAGGAANSQIRAPDTLAHRYYREDFGHGLLPFLELAAIAGVDAPVAASLFRLAEAATGIDYRQGGRTAESMGIAGMTKAGLLARVRA